MLRGGVARLREQRVEVAAEAVRILLEHTSAVVHHLARVVPHLVRVRVRGRVRARAKG